MLRRASRWWSTSASLTSGSSTAPRRASCRVRTVDDGRWTVAHLLSSIVHRLRKEDMVGPLDGVRVIELARFQAGPRAGMLLSDLGAEVIKVERIGGEETRNNPPIVRGQSVYFTVYNRGKKSICLNMRTDEGKRIFAELVRKTDIVL